MPNSHAVGMRLRIHSKRRIRRSMESTAAIPEKQRHIGCLMVRNQQIGIAVSVKVSNPDIAGQMSSWKRRARRLLELSFPISKENGYSSGFRICYDYIRGTVMVHVGDGDRIRVPAYGNHSRGKLHFAGIMNLG
jgi:hypothetical protein